MFSYDLIQPQHRHHQELDHTSVTRGGVSPADVAVPQCDFDGGDLYEQLIPMERALVLDLQEDDVMIDGDDENCEQLKSLEREFCQLDQKELDVQIQIRKLKCDQRRAKEDLRRLQITPLVVGQLAEIVDEHHAVVTLSDGSQRKRCVRVLSTIDSELLKPTANVLLHGRSCALVGVLPGARRRRRLGRIPRGGL
ncbi:hypothetical protein GUJ93_ZPchr0009g401 [Zizania palustris]|uniref:Proteasomal ATPase second OB domain-containing protein n=1 Tax=Zizania palustris TaxID=103762 RepID=A0A8J5R3C1_ZIZPA|nr:hypothetical protein GUJ93_ZPchr0009g401 [Zizania palustris]